MTKKEAVEKHRLLWNTIAEESLKQKKKIRKWEALDLIGETEDIVLDCYCCHFDAQFSCDCSHCPIDWGKNYKKDACLFSLYHSWCMLTRHEYEEAAKCARNIAELPEDENV